VCALSRQYDLKVGTQTVRLERPAACEIGETGAGGLKPVSGGAEDEGANALKSLALERGETQRTTTCFSPEERTIMLARLTKATKEKDKDKGFTLIELLVVIIIIGILAAIAIPIFLNQRKKGVDASIKSDVKQFATQIETYYTDNQSYPATVTQTAAGADITVGGETVTVSEGNVLTYTLNGNTFKICGYNAGGTADALDNVFKYESGEGGLLPNKEACTAATP